MDPFFDADRPLPNRVCVRVRDLDLDMPLLSPASVAVASLKPLCVEAFRDLLTRAWLYDDRSPFANCDYRFVIDYVEDFDKVCDHPESQSLLGRCVNLPEIARGLVTLLECYSPYKVANKCAALELRDRLLTRAQRIVEYLEAFE